MALAAIISHADDTVATAVRDLEPGETVTASGAGKEVRVSLKERITFGHKFALVAIPAGREIVKYGETIGRSTAPISPGDHVHLHNLEGLRGRGDIQ